MKRYIAKPHTYFDEGTEAKLIGEAHVKFVFALFEGYRFGELDQEICRFDEFEIAEFEDDYDSFRD